MTSRPITFSCEATLPQKPEEIANQILDLAKWPEFNGYGPLPGIKQAEFETKTAEIVGTRIRVTNRDGSTHIEEIVEWEPTRRPFTVDAFRHSFMSSRHTRSSGESRPVVANSIRPPYRCQGCVQ